MKSPSFEPSFRILSRILEVLLKEDSVTKTVLSQEARINYTRFLKHLDWLVERQIVELNVEHHKIAVKLTKRGKRIRLETFRSF